MLSFQKKKCGTARDDKFSHQHFARARARRVIFTAIHKEKLKHKVILWVTVLNSVKRKMVKNEGYFRLASSNDLCHRTCPLYVTCAVML